MASKFIKTFSFVLYGIVTFLLLCAVLVLIFKDDKSSCSNPSLSSISLSHLFNDSDTTVTKSGHDPDNSASSPTATTEFDFTGKYELYSSENFDEFLTELGVGYFTRLAATRASSEYIITKEGEEYTLRTVSTFGESTITFKSGVEFEENRLDGATVQTTIIVKGNKWIQKQRGGDSEVDIVREFSPEGVTVTSVVNSIGCIRKYKRI